MNTEENEVENEAEVEQVEVEKPKRKPRKPRKPKAAAAEADDEEPRAKRGERAEQFIRQEGNKLTLSGRGVTLNGLSKQDIKKWHIESVSGAVGKPCKEPMTLLFKNRRAALDFFNACLEDESEDDEVISATEAVNWYSEELGF